jgi:hypothetical protein
MSVKAMAYVWETPYKGAQKLMLLAIADRCDDEGTCYPGVAKLAEKCGIKTRAAQALITELERNDEIVAQIGTGIETGHGKTNRYFMKRYRASIGLKTPMHGTRIQQITPLENGVQYPASLDYGVQKSASQAMQDPASQGVQKSAYNTSGDTSVDTSVKEKETTYVPSGTAHVSPVNEPFDLSFEAVDPVMFPVKGEKQISALEEKGSKRLSKPTTTTPPSPTPSPAAPVAVDDVERFSGTLDAAKGEKINPAVALGEAWGIAPANGDFGLYMRKAKELLKDIPIEEFKAYCDWRKKQAGDFASKLSIATLTGNGHVSAYLAQRNEAAEKARKQKEAEERLYAQNPHLIPPDAPVEYASPDEVRALILAAMKPATNTREEAS